MISKLVGFNIFSSTSEAAEKEVPQEVKTTRARQRVIHSIEARLNERRTMTEKLADDLVRFLGNFRFALVNLLFFVSWIAINLGYVPGVQAFDSPPFIMLINIVSLEAIFLSIVVLMTQNRAARIADLREQVDLQVNIRSEREAEKTLEMLSAIERRLRIRKKLDPELVELLQKIDMNVLEQKVLHAIEEADKE